MHICISNLTIIEKNPHKNHLIIIGSDNGLLPGQQSGTKPNLVAKILATKFGSFL